MATTTMRTYVTELYEKGRMVVISVYQKDYQSYSEINIIKMGNDEFYFYTTSFGSFGRMVDNHFMIILHKSVFPVERYMGQLLYTLSLPFDAWDHILDALRKLGPDDETLYSVRSRSIST